MKPKTFMLTFVVFSLFTLSVMVQAAQAAAYSIEIKKGDKFVWEIKSFNKALSDKVFGEDSVEDLLNAKDIDVGATTQNVIKEVEEEDDYWLLTYDDWDFTMKQKDLEDDADDKDVEKKIYKDPADLGKNVVPIFLADYIPTDAASYLKKIDWADDTEVNGLTITQSVEKADLKAFWSGADEDAKFQFVFASNGVKVTTRYLSDKGEVILEIGFKGNIPGYEIPVLLGLTAISTVGLIYLILKKK